MIHTLYGCLISEGVHVLMCYVVHNNPDEFILISKPTNAYVVLKKVYTTEETVYANLDDLEYILLQKTTY